MHVHVHVRNGSVGSECIVGTRAWESPSRDRDARGVPSPLSRPSRRDAPHTPERCAPGPLAWHRPYDVPRAHRVRPVRVPPSFVLFRLHTSVIVVETARGPLRARGLPVVAIDRSRSSSGRHRTMGDASDD
eukprot:1399827-Prymnesium_polylepis.1